MSDKADVLGYSDPQVLALRAEVDAALRARDIANVARDADITHQADNLKLQKDNISYLIGSNAAVMVAIGALVSALRSTRMLAPEAEEHFYVTLRDGVHGCRNETKPSYCNTVEALLIGAAASPGQPFRPN